MASTSSDLKQEAPSPEDQADVHFIPYPPVERLAVIGDRRTAAMVAADGTVCWTCLPRFDATPVFGVLLDVNKGGYWRLGPEDRDFGEQRYIDGTAVLTTTWTSPEAVLDVTECMLWPEDERAPGLAGRRVVVRRLRVVSGRRGIAHRIEPREDFRTVAALSEEAGALRISMRGFELGLWCSHEMEIGEDQDQAHLVAEFEAGDELWAVLDDAEHAESWTVERARAALDITIAYWKDWSGRLSCKGSRAEEIRFAAIVVHLCTYAPTGALVAAPTTSLPERVPGHYNYDYRYCWIRDGSLTVSLLAQLGMTTPVSRFLDFVAARLRPETDGTSKMPLQVLYRIDGGAQTPKDERGDISGYRDCQPVHMGNPVFQMHEIDGFGFLAECIAVFVARGGKLEDRHWEIMRRVADYIAENWAEKDAGTWELMPSQDFTSTRVMNWVTLDRAIKVAEKTGRKTPARWAQSRERVREDVLEHGWSEKAGAFRQRYGSDALDATALLIPLMGFLPPNDPKVRATVERIDKVLKLNGLVHRFVPIETPGRPDQPMGDREGAFLMCTMWLAEAWQMMGETDKAKRTLERAEACRGVTRLFSEAGDSRQTPGLLGNMPLLFTQVAYARAAQALG